MTLQLTEIVPGAIAYFDATTLNSDKNISISGDPVSRAGAGNQFVCYKTDGDRSWWAPLTATERPERLRIEGTWISDGYGPLAKGDVFLQDGKNTYCGPNASFIAATTNEATFKVRRPMISATGVSRVQRIVVERGGQT